MLRRQLAQIVLMDRHSWGSKASINRLRDAADADPTAVVVFNQSLGHACTVDSTGVPLDVLRKEAAWRALKVRAFGLEDRVVHFVAAKQHRVGIRDSFHGGHLAGGGYKCVLIHRGERRGRP